MRKLSVFEEVVFLSAVMLKESAIEPDIVKEVRARLDEEVGAGKIIEALKKLKKDKFLSAVLSEPNEEPVYSMTPGLGLRVFTNSLKKLNDKKEQETGGRRREIEF